MRPATQDMAPIPSYIGKYRVERRVGEGGMGTVYLAHDEGIDRLVAIKLLRADHDEMRLRFKAEARAVGKLKHPNIVTVYDYTDWEGSPCIVMEFVEGDTLAGLMRREEPVPLSRRLQIIEQVCRGLAYAHRAGIVHRDIKPSNLMVDRDGIVKIVDFGIARTGGRGLTRTGNLVGTLAYMAPEQIRGESVDRRCDIFAIGLVLYEFLTGASAFPGDSDFSIFNRIVSGHPEPFRHPSAVVNELVTPIIDTALAKDPANRYQDADQMAAALAAVRRKLTSTPSESPTAVLPGSKPKTARWPPLETETNVALPLVAPKPALETIDDAGRIIVTPQGRFTPPPDSPPPDVSSHNAETRPLTPTPMPPAPVAKGRRSFVLVAGGVFAATAVIAVAVNLSLPRDVPQDPSAGAAPAAAPPATSIPTPEVLPPTPASPAPTVDPAKPTTTAPQDPPRPQFTQRLANASRLFEDAEYTEAVAAYESILREDSGNQAAARGLQAVKKAQLAEAAILNRGSSGGTPPAADAAAVAARLSEARQKFDDGEYDAAIAAYDAVLKIDPKNARALSGREDTRKAKAAEERLRGTKKPGG